MARDPQVDLVLSHMTPRYLATGVDPNDLQRLMARIERWDDWCRIWCAEAACHEDLAQQAARRNRNVTASEFNLRALLSLCKAPLRPRSGPIPCGSSADADLLSAGCRGC